LSKEIRFLNYSAQYKQRDHIIRLEIDIYDTAKEYHEDCIVKSFSNDPIYTASRAMFSPNRKYNHTNRRSIYGTLRFSKDKLNRYIIMHECNHVIFTLCKSLKIRDMFEHEEFAAVHLAALSDIMLDKLWDLNL